MFFDFDRRENVKIYVKCEDLLIMLILYCHLLEITRVIKFTRTINRDCVEA